HLEQGKYCFKIDNDCNKYELKALLKEIFSVDAVKINISNVEGKPKRFKGVIGSRSSYKKAIVTVKKGQSINFEGLN
ncbi:MAG: large subunit ribosomal protein L23, partial [Lentimonas sp.]